MALPTRCGRSRLRQAWQETDHDIALEQLNNLALELDRPHPGTAASLREGMSETLTVIRLGVTGKLHCTASTGPALRPSPRGRHGPARPRAARPSGPRDVLREPLAPTGRELSSLQSG